MELQGSTVQDVMSRQDDNQAKIRKLIEDKTNLQSKNVDLLEEMRILQRQISDIEEAKRFQNLRRDSEQDDMESNNLSKQKNVSLFTKSAFEK